MEKDPCQTKLTHQIHNLEHEIRITLHKKNKKKYDSELIKG
jgi:hypothetical protein